jgi:hypothetical protein
MIMSIKTILSLSLLLTSTSSLKLINPKVLLSSSSLSSLSSLSMSTTSYDLVLDPFGKRQFNNKDYMGTQVFYNEIEFEKIVNEYYSPLKEFYDDKVIKNILNILPQKCKNLLKLVKVTPSFTEITYKENSIHNIFDKNIYCFLHLR